MASGMSLRTLPSASAEVQAGISRNCHSSFHRPVALQPRCPRRRPAIASRHVRTLRRAHPGWFELAVFALAYATYFGVRALTEGKVSDAIGNAIELVHVERKLDLNWEDAVQGARRSASTRSSTPSTPCTSGGTGRC